MVGWSVRRILGRDPQAPPRSGLVQSLLCRIRHSSDFYEIIFERHRRTSTIVTSNRSIDEWIPLFDDPILAQSALDRLAHNAYQVVIDGDSYRSRQRPGIAPSTPPQRRSN